MAPKDIVLPHHDPQQWRTIKTYLKEALCDCNDLKELIESPCDQIQTDRDTTIQDFSELCGKVFDSLQKACEVLQGRCSRNLFGGLKQLLNAKNQEELGLTGNKESVQFMKKTLPCIIEQAVNIEQLKTSIPMYLANSTTHLNELLSCNLTGQDQINVYEIKLLRSEVASLLATMILCLIPDKPLETREDFNDCDYTLFHSTLRVDSGSQLAKFRMVNSFFNSVADFGVPTGEITYQKQVGLMLPRNLEAYMQSDHRLCDLEVKDEGRIEDDPSALAVDFANEYIGGGVLLYGDVQEEIRFCTAPELQVSMIFMSCMGTNESIRINGFETFSDYKGYSCSLQFNEDFVYSPAQRDKNGCVSTSITAIDAQPYALNVSDQYDQDNILRDLNKAVVGFYQPAAFKNPSYLGDKSSRYEIDRTLSPKTEGMEQYASDLAKQIVVEANSKFKSPLQEILEYRPLTVNTTIPECVNEDMSDIYETPCTTPVGWYGGDHPIVNYSMKFYSKISEYALGLASCVMNQAVYSAGIQAASLHYAEEGDQNTLVSTSRYERVNSQNRTLVTQQTTDRNKSKVNVASLRNMTTNSTENSSYNTNIDENSTSPVVCRKRVLNAEAFTNMSSRTKEWRVESSASMVTRSRTLPATKQHSDVSPTKSPLLESAILGQSLSDSLKQLMYEYAEALSHDVITWALSEVKERRRLLIENNVNSREFVAATKVSEKVISKIFNELRAEAENSISDSEKLSRMTTGDNMNTGGADGAAALETLSPVYNQVIQHKYSKSNDETALSHRDLSVSRRSSVPLSTKKKVREEVRRGSAPCLLLSSLVASNETSYKPYDYIRREFCNERRKSNETDNRQSAGPSHRSSYDLLWDELTRTQSSERLDLLSKPNSSRSRSPASDSGSAEHCPSSWFEQQKLPAFMEDLTEEEPAKLRINVIVTTEGNDVIEQLPSDIATHKITHKCSHLPQGDSKNVVNRPGALKDISSGSHFSIAVDYPETPLPETPLHQSNGSSTSKSYSSTNTHSLTPENLNLPVDSVSNADSLSSAYKTNRALQLPRFTSSPRSNSLDNQPARPPSHTATSQTRELHATGYANNGARNSSAIHSPLHHQYLTLFSEVLAENILHSALSDIRSFKQTTSSQSSCTLSTGSGNVVRMTQNLEPCRHIATGNWGSGAFGGDPQLKSLIQWVAASRSRCPRLVYYTFNDERVGNGKLKKVVEALKDHRVCDVMRFIECYSTIAKRKRNISSLFEFIFNELAKHKDGQS